MPKNWRLDHDPEARPLGCNGKYGTSGSKVHRYRGETPCEKCKASEAHYARELSRGQNLPRIKHGCGTWQKAEWHIKRGEPVDFACRAARSDYRNKLAAEKASLPLDLHTEAERLVKRILSKRRRGCHNQRRHTPECCQACGVHYPAGRLKVRAALPSN